MYSHKLNFAGFPNASGKQQPKMQEEIRKSKIRLKKEALCQNKDCKSLLKILIKSLRKHHKCDKSNTFSILVTCYLLKVYLFKVKIKKCLINGQKKLLLVKEGILTLTE